MAFLTGDFIGVVCEVKDGPFDDEKVVVVDTVNGPISGFVRNSELREVNGRWEVRGRVEELNGEVIKVLIFGSFFTTNGIADIRSSSAMAA